MELVEQRARDAEAASLAANSYLAVCEELQVGALYPLCIRSVSALYPLTARHLAQLQARRAPHCTDRVRTFRRAP